MTPLRSVPAAMPAGPTLRLVCGVAHCRQPLSPLASCLPYSGSVRLRVGIGGVGFGGGWGEGRGEKGGWVRMGVCPAGLYVWQVWHLHKHVYIIIHEPLI